MSHIRHCCVFDLETGFIRKGCRRTDTPILEIGAVFPNGETFQTFTNPYLDSPLSLYDSIVEDGKIKVSSTLSFWHSLLFDRTARGTDKEVGAKVEAELLKLQVPSTETALQSFEKFIKDNAEDIPSTALVAHNGNSFDFKIMDGNAVPGSFWDTNSMHYIDSYRQIARPLYPERKKYGLAPLYRDLVGGTFNHHRALDDSRATLQVLQVCAKDYAEKNDLEESLNDMLVHLGLKGRAKYTKRERLNPIFGWASSAVSFVLRSKSAPELSLEKCNPMPLQSDLRSAPELSLEKCNPLPLQSDLRSIPNVGPKTEAKLQSMGVHTVAELVDMRRASKNLPEFLRTLNGLYRYKKLGEYIDNLA